MQTGGMMELPVKLALEQRPEEWVHPCPYYRFYHHLAGSDRWAKCWSDCHEEPLCVTNEPALGWQEDDLK